MNEISASVREVHVQRCTGVAQALHTNHYSTLESRTVVACLIFILDAVALRVLANFVSCQEEAAVE